MTQADKNLALIENFILYLTHVSDARDIDFRKPQTYTPKELYRVAYDYIQEDHVDGKENPENLIEIETVKESKGKWIGVEIDLFDTTQKVLIGLGVEGGDVVEHCNTEDIKINPDNPWCSNAEFSVKDEDERVFDDNHQLIK